MNCGKTIETPTTIKNPWQKVGEKENRYPQPNINIKMNSLPNINKAA